ncbi:MAG: hypothetical protein AB7I40_14400 [Nocardioides sp.]
MWADSVEDGRPRDGGIHLSDEVARVSAWLLGAIFALGDREFVQSVVHELGGEGYLALRAASLTEVQDDDYDIDEWSETAAVDLTMNNDDALF